MDDNDVKILQPIDDVFQEKHVLKDNKLLVESTPYNIFEAVKYPDEGGIYTYYKGLPYPRKGFPFPEVIWMNDIAKKVTMTLIKSVGQKDLGLSLLAFAILPYFVKIRIIENVLDNYSRMQETILNSFFLKEERYSNVCRSLNKLIKVFLKEIGIKKDWICDLTAKVFITMIEYDDAYRYRVEDIFTSTSRTSLIQNPIKETRRLVKLFNQRETDRKPQQSIKAMGLILSLALLQPKVRRAFKTAMGGLNIRDWRWLTLDNADRYHVLLRGDYNFLGRTYTERLELYKQFHKDNNIPYPPMIKIKK